MKSASLSFRRELFSLPEDKFINNIQIAFFMGLEGKLEQLQALEVGSVEGVIGDIERTKVETLEVADNIEIEAQVYQQLIEQKLPKLLGNVQSLRSMVLGIVPLEGDYVDSHDKLYIFQNKKGHQLSWWDISKYDFNFQFNNDGSEEISLLRFGPLKGFFRSERCVWIKMIDAKTPEEFVEKYVGLVIPEFKKHGDSIYLSLPFALVNVPDSIKRIYEKRQEKRNGVLKQIQSQNGKLDSLSVPQDII